MGLSTANMGGGGTQETTPITAKLFPTDRFRERWSHPLQLHTHYSKESSNPMVTHIAVIKLNRSQDKPEVINLGKGLVGIEGFSQVGGR